MHISVWSLNFLYSKDIFLPVLNNEETYGKLKLTQIINIELMKL